MCLIFCCQTKGRTKTNKACCPHCGCSRTESRGAAEQIFVRLEIKRSQVSVNRNYWHEMHVCNMKIILFILISTLHSYGLVVFYICRLIEGFRSSSVTRKQTTKRSCQSNRAKSSRFVLIDDVSLNYVRNAGCHNSNFERISHLMASTTILTCGEEVNNRQMLALWVSWVFIDWATVHIFLGGKQMKQNSDLNLK